MHDLPVTTPPDAAFGFANLLPEVPENAAYSPVFRYPWTTAVAALEAAPRGADSARRLRYVNPVTGGATMTLLDCSLMEIDAGRETAAFKTSSHSVVAVMEGRGSTRSDDATISWGPKDVFSVPSGQWVTYRAEERTRLFFTTDREVLR